MTYTEVQQLFDLLPALFRPEKARQTDLAVQFELTGEAGGEWFVQVQHGALTVARGRAKSPSLTVRARAADVLALANGDLDPMQAYLRGRLQVTGDLKQVAHLQALFHMPAGRP